MNVSFGGMGEVFATFKTSGTVTAGTPVQMAESGTVKACDANGRFMGIAVTVSDDGYANVQVKGYAELGYETAPDVGYAKIAGTADGKVTANDNGGEYAVISLDTAAKTVGFIM